MDIIKLPRMKILMMWRNVSIAKKLYLVIGVMAVLIVLELAILWFAMNTLSSVRAFVGGEGLWSKAQKNAVLSLQSYSITHDEQDYENFLRHLEVNEGDHIARIELEKKSPDLERVRQGFLQGRNHRDDINSMITLIRRFHKIPYLAQAIQAWRDADNLLAELKSSAAEYHQLVVNKSKNKDLIERSWKKIHILNERLTVLEDRFSTVLGMGSRWLESLIIGLLSLVVLMVEGIGLTLAFVTTRSISRDLSEISSAASAIGKGDFNRTIKIRSADEIGVVGTSINQMAEMLRKSYTELENRVKERTEELAHAVKARDNFLSLASHELKTPLTSQSLQIQMRQRLFSKNPTAYSTPENMQKIFESDEKHLKRLIALVNEMLDISRLSAKKLELQLVECDLSEIVSQVVERFTPNLAAAKCEITTDLAKDVIGNWDHSRIEQVLENLLINAMKYGDGKPIHIRTWKEGSQAKVSVKDHGIGIDKKDQERIFKQFERAVNDIAISGLGLGLYIAREITASHGGSLEVESEIQAGSTFTLSLPL